MKKVLAFVVGAALVILILANLNHIIGLAINLVILYFALKQYLKSTTVFGKLFWGGIGLIALLVGIGNFSSLIGILAIGFLYMVYKDWKLQKTEQSTNQHDPFTNFEQQWEQMKKNHF